MAKPKVEDMIWNKYENLKKIDRAVKDYYKTDLFQNIGELGKSNKPFIIIDDARRSKFSGADFELDKIHKYLTTTSG